MQILLDTDIMIDVIRQFTPALSWLSSLAQTTIVLPRYVVLELLQGCQNKSQQIVVQQTLTQCRIIWPTEAACNNATTMFAQYHLSHNLGFIDALIAQTAIEHALPLHTFNQKHYSFITNLTTTQPYRKDFLLS